MEEKIKVSKKLLFYLKSDRAYGDVKYHDCNKSRKNRSKESWLIINHITKSSVYLCMEYGEVFDKKSQLTIHQRNHTAQKPYQCIGCGETFAQNSQLTTDQRTHSVEKPYSCYECHKIFSKKSLLIQHQKIHTGEKPYACSVCGKAFGGKLQQKKT